jgi:protein TonB
MTSWPNTSGGPALDDQRWRMLWIVPLSIALWFVILEGFARVLEQSAPPPPESTTVQAQIVELPPQSNPAGAIAHPAAAAPPRPIEKPKPVVRHHPMPRHREVVHPPSPSGAAKATEQPHEAAPASSAAPAGGTSTSHGPASPAGSGFNLGGGASGARAVYAPTPTIPDDLRDQQIDTVAIAHFVVKADGTDDVTLSQPTSIPELNQVLLDTLKQWRFFPAVRNGVAIDSEFDVRIPITVQ